MGEIKWLAGICCESGIARQNNEDNFYFNGLLKTIEQINLDFSAQCEFTDNGLFAVFDGMGGESYGELASSMAASMLRGHAKSIVEKNHIRQFIREANKRICLEAAKRNISMGTTLVMAVILANRLQVCSLGDSRAYLLRGEKLARLTVDHTQGERKPLSNKRSHKLSQYLGIAEEQFIIEPHNAETALFPGDKILLCSDGLTDMLCDYAIKSIIMTDMHPKAIARELVEASIIEGGKDNITALVIAGQG